MKKFTDFNIATTHKSFVGDKIKIDRLLNRKIAVLEYKVEKSKFQKGSEKCLHLQIELEGKKHVVFIGSDHLINLIEQVPKEGFPFETTIAKPDYRYEFT